MVRIAAAALVLMSLSISANVAPVQAQCGIQTAAIHEHNSEKTPVSDNVSFNTKTKKYHNSSCRYWGCADCVTTSKADAQKRGGTACKVCNG